MKKNFIILYFFLSQLFIFSNSTFAATSTLPECINSPAGLAYADKKIVRKWHNCFGVQSIAQIKNWGNGQYHGEFKNGKWNGVGTFIFTYISGNPSGRKIFGQWKNGNYLGVVNPQKTLKVVNSQNSKRASIFKNWGETHFEGDKNDTLPTGFNGKDLVRTDPGMQ
jgi:hypothetical protein